MTPARAAASALAKRIVEIATAGDYVTFDELELAREYQELEREVEEALQLTESCSSLKQMAIACVQGAVAEASNVRLREVVKAAARWDADLSSDCDTDDRTALRAALAALQPGDRGEEG